eukprot:CAMPEP_0172909446 /NCGR_PEP_ID=MMETSP1075-20121228/182702_1 /TAXON_ID=2916 /ORGANISM="Ceratium fusus, Strain PA161109" /LENGTH=77 /DNA_ID=CAMNT_0013767399 /DNA_START=135 /DNA_END=365 /DNA_ORIENTATION=-
MQQVEKEQPPIEDQHLQEEVLEQQEPTRHSEDTDSAAPVLPSEESPVELPGQIDDTDAVAPASSTEKHLVAHSVTER